MLQIRDSKDNHRGTEAQRHRGTEAQRHGGGLVSSLTLWLRDSVVRK